LAAVSAYNFSVKLFCQFDPERSFSGGSRPANNDKLTCFVHKDIVYHRFIIFHYSYYSDHSDENSDN